ncbi:uncharacterized protein B0J16DRAFT_357191 [Fusarium flagelliforme]|uniref:uncharacterized protein n=1 Tax=Fusarium flagelliforme TaxID=2675880 RepID=UPI001E8EBF26|nr:uncharacterized protein B0J16DRAFT_357191 [Fusarium flagelliforme]KAH7178994.1 hypothetical protein B0J16DRAFT_357191 [Fusarium flagelliforme]
MPSFNYPPDKSQHGHERRHHQHHDDKKSSHRDHHHHHHHHAQDRPMDDNNAMNMYQRPEWWGHLKNRLALETFLTELIEPSGHKDTRSSNTHNRNQHALQKGVRIGAEVALRIKNKEDSGLGEKTVKVMSAAIASATFDLLLGTEAESHPITSAAMSMVEENTLFSLH